MKLMVKFYLYLHSIFEPKNLVSQVPMINFSGVISGNGEAQWPHC